MKISHEVEFDMQNLLFHMELRPYLKMMQETKFKIRFEKPEILKSSELLKD